MRGLISWFVDNPIASKLLMILIVTLGLLSFPLLDKEFFPQTKIDLIRVSVAYPGASPAQVEQQICARIEESVRQLAAIEEIRSIAREGFGEVVIEAEAGGDTQRLLNDVEAAVNAINTFPIESERPQIVEQRWKNTFMRLQLAGEVDERTLKEIGEEIREELAALPSVALVELHRPRNYEVAIELSESSLRHYDLSFGEVAAAVRGYSFNLPAGKLRTDDGDIALQTRAQADVASEFENIPIRHNGDGSRLRVGDVATVVDGFEEVDIYSALDGRPSLEFWVRNQSQPNILRASRSVKDYLEQKSRSLPEAVELSLWADASSTYRCLLYTSDAADEL